MDSRCTKFWEDGQTLVAAISGPTKIETTQGKIIKKLVDCVGHYVGLGKEGGAMLPVAEATFQTVRDGLAMPFNVVGTKQKKRLLKWYNELIAIVGGDPDAAITGEVETGETSESFGVKKKSAELKRIKKALENSEVTVVTSGDDIEEIRVENE
ncbi:hypothetical protein PI125_g12849 [Phytophthora idaei]|nr:hypothetical protein PI125_g12849 [Phytophthora idaei]KAG3149584.1 hypothetical protein PI126_g11948 [Phytophthora idaei]